MLSRRIATFLMGAWVGCGILLSILVLQNLSFAQRLLADPSDGARILFVKVGDEESRQLMEYVSSEQNRAYLFGWEQAQMVIAVVIVAVLALSSQRRFLPLILTSLMLVFVLFQHFGVTPEMTFRGRQADFLSEEASFSVQARLWTLTQIYAGLEAAKLILGGIVASYFFVASSGARSRKKKRRAEDLPPSRSPGRDE